MTATLKMSRDRVQEFIDAGAGDTTLMWCGPIDTGVRFCTEGQPTVLEDLDFITDTSEWTYQRILVEPDWRCEQSVYGRWQVYAHNPRDHWARWRCPQWVSEDRAHAYLRLLQEDWWAQ